MILHRLQRRYRIGIGCRRRPIKIPDFQPIFNNILLPKCFASGALPRTPLGGGFRRPQTPSWDTLQRAPQNCGPQGPETPRSATVTSNTFKITQQIIGRNGRQTGRNRCTCQSTRKELRRNVGITERSLCFRTQARCSRGSYRDDWRYSLSQSYQ